MVLSGKKKKIKAQKSNTRGQRFNSANGEALVSQSLQGSARKRAAGQKPALGAGSAKHQLGWSSEGRGTLAAGQRAENVFTKRDCPDL